MIDGISLFQTSYVLFAVCGVNLPLSALPPIVRLFSHALPITNGLLALPQVVNGAPHWQVSGLIAAQVLIGVIYTSGAWLIFPYRLRVAREWGTLELV